MSGRDVDRIVAATLYEGYILYPYRPSSVKNQVRWTFGGVHPRAWSEATGGTEAASARTECLLRDEGGATVDVEVRFLHLVTRTVMRLEATVPELDEAAEAGLRPTAELGVAGTLHRPWEEATERTVECGAHPADSLLGREVVVDAVIPGGRELEPLRDEGSRVAGALVREHEPLAVEIRLGAEADGDAVRVRVVVSNVTDVDAAALAGREAAMRRSLVSTHAILVARGGRWLSLADPPDAAREAAARCINTGLWPVLVGEPGAADTVLASPIILDDHPRVAPESAGDLYDATEIDEILSLRILTLTDDEKAEMRAADTRAAAMLERTEALGEEALLRLHGTIRELRPARGRRA